MYIDKFKTADGYEDKDGCYYEDAVSFIAGSVLDFCTCGDPEAALEYTREALQLIDILKQRVWKGLLTYEQWVKLKGDVFSSYGEEYFMWYFLSNKDLVEHGSSLPGWLTQAGEELLSDLNELKKEGTIKN